MTTPAFKKKAKTTMTTNRFRRLALATTFIAGILPAVLPGAASAAESGGAALRDRPVQDEVIYFLLVDRFENADPTNDTGGISGGPRDHGFDPTQSDFYNGGDLKGVIRRLEYIKGLGATAIWVSPVFVNKPVQVFRDYVSAGYHGYWKTDYLNVDPHFGNRDDFRQLVESAHAKGLKVYLDIVINHTADVVQARECHDPAVAGSTAKRGADCAYRPLGQKPYTPFVDPAEARVKNPPWLNDPRFYNNRGESTFKGESSIKGDFAGLDDLDTTNPKVVAGLIDIYKRWITDFRIDGYRIDTARHVETSFWQAFIPAIMDHARAEGIPNFHIFGEVYEFEPEVLSRFTRDDRFPAVLDFAFQSAAVSVASGRNPPNVLAGVWAKDGLYAQGERTAAVLPTFLGNHDMGRVGWFLRKDRPGMADAETLSRDILAHGLMMFGRGVPVIYYGDEQGFAGEGGYGASRESLFPSRVPSFRGTDPIGTDSTPAAANFNPDHPLYRAIAAMAAARAAEPALRRGGQAVLRADDKPGILAFSRGEPGKGGVFVIANSATEAMRVDLPVPAGAALRSVYGRCEAAPGGGLTVAPLSILVCGL